MEKTTDQQRVSFTAEKQMRLIIAVFTAALFVSNWINTKITEGSTHRMYLENEKKRIEKAFDEEKEANKRRRQHALDKNDLLLKIKDLEHENALLKLEMKLK